MSDSVGKVSLELEVQGDIERQLHALVGRMGSGLKSAIGKASNVDFSGLEKTLSKTMQHMNTSIEKMAANMEAGFKIKTPTIKAKIDKETIQTEMDRIDHVAGNLQKQIVFLEKKIVNLKESYRNTFDNTKKTAMEGQILKTEQAVIALQGKLEGLTPKWNALDDKMVSLTSNNNSDTVTPRPSPNMQLPDIPSANAKLLQFGAATEKVSKTIKRSTDSMGAGFLKLGNMFKLMLLRMSMRAVVSATKEGFQNLAKYSKSFNKDMSTLMSSMTQLKNGFATAFAPILSAIVPALKTFISYVIAAVNAFGQFAAALFGKGTFIKAKEVQEDYAASLDKTGSAAKKAANAMLGMDELNVVSPPDASSGSSSGGLNPNDMFETTEIDSKILEMVDKFKSALQPTIEALGRLKDALKPFKDFIFTGLKDFYESFLKPVGTWVLGEGIPRLVDAFIYMISGINWSGLNESLENFWDALAPFVVSVGEGLLKFIEDLSVFLKPALEFTVKLLAIALNMLAESINKISPQQAEDIGYGLGMLTTGFLGLKTLGWIAGIAQQIKTFFMALPSNIAATGGLFVPGFQVLGTEIWEQFDKHVIGYLYSKSPEWLKGVIDFLSGRGELWNSINTFMSGLAGKIGIALGDAIKAAFNTLFNFNSTKALFADAAEHFKKTVDGESGFFEVGKNIILGIVKGLAGAVVFVFEPLVDLLEAIRVGLCNLFGIHSPAREMEFIGENIVLGVMEGIKAVITGIKSWMKSNFVDPIINGVKTLFGGAVELFSGFWENVKNVFGNVSGWFGEKFQGAREKVNGAFSNVGEWFRERYSNIKTAIQGAPEYFKEKFSNAYTNTQEAFSSVGGWFGEKYTDVTNAFSKSPTWFKDTFGSTYTNIQDAIEPIGGWFAQKYTDVQTAFQESPAWFQDTFANAYSNIQSAIEPIGSFFGEKYGNIQDSIKEAPEWLKATFQNAYDNITSVFDPIKTFFKGIGDVLEMSFKNGVNGAVAIMNKFIGWVNEKLNISWDSISIAGVEIVPAGSFQLFKIPPIPALAQGGFVGPNTPQLAMIGDNRHQGEVVAPENKLRQMALEAVQMAGKGSSDDSQYLMQMIALLKDIIDLVKNFDMVVNIDIRELHKKLGDLEKRMGYSFN